jgi:hypothetical protein
MIQSMSMVHNVPCILLALMKSLKAYLVAQKCDWGKYTLGSSRLWLQSAGAMHPA